MNPLSAAEYLCDPFIFPSQRQKERREGSPWHRGCKQNNKITAVTGRPTHLSRSSRQWHLLGNWGCQSASPAALLCSSCSSLKEPLQNRQRTKPPETSGSGEWGEKKEKQREGFYIKMHEHEKHLSKRLLIIATNCVTFMLVFGPLRNANVWYHCGCYDEWTPLINLLSPVHCH